jgi:hypothetical protein
MDRAVPVARLTAGVVQPIWWPLRRSENRYRVSVLRYADDWRNVRILVVATVVLICASYFLSIRVAGARVLPGVPNSAFFALSCWQLCARAAGDRWRRWERLAMVVIVAGVIVHSGLAIDRSSRQSLYANRALVVSAISDRNDRYLGDRRDTIYATEDHRPRPIDHVGDPDGYLAANATGDLHVVRADWRPVDVPLLGQVSVFSLAITNGGREIAWLDLRFEVVFAGADGRVAAHEGDQDVLEPGETSGRSPRRNGPLARLRLVQADGADERYRRRHTGALGRPSRLHSLRLLSLYNANIPRGQTFQAAILI